MHRINLSVSLFPMAALAVLLQACGHCPDGAPRLNKRQQDVIHKIEVVNGIGRDSLVYPDQNEYEGGICSTDSLLGLRLSKKGLRIIPPEVKDLRSLQYFHLDSNEIDSLPEEFALVDIRRLRVDGNKICNPSAKIAGFLTGLQPDWKSTQRCP